MFKACRFAGLAAVVCAAGASFGSSARAALAVTASAIPQPAAENSLADVACVSSSDCWAVGSAQDVNNNVSDEILH